MNIGFQLFQLQQVDSEIDAAQYRIAEIDRLVESDDAVQTAKAVYEKSYQINKQLNTSFNLINDEVQSKNIKKTQSESNLYGGSVKNPKELQDIQQEISSLRSIISRLEDDLLEKMLGLEESEKTVKKNKQQLNQALSVFETRKSLLLGEKYKLRNSIKNLKSNKETILTQIDQSSLNIYETLRKSKNGKAVAKLQDESCSECGTYLTPNQCQQARSASTLFYCSGCRRIIYGS